MATDIIPAATALLKAQSRDHGSVELHHVQGRHQEKNHINGIENFWNQAKRHMRRYNGIPKTHFHLFLKECEWRFNHRPASNLLKTIAEWVKM